MSTRASAHRGLNYGRGGTFRASERIGHSASLGRDELQPGNLIIGLNATDILPSSGPAQISNFQCIASYNWLDKSEPTILVPGSPATWSPPAHRRRLEPDKGEVFIDQNAARYSSFPLEAMFRAIYGVRPEINLDDVDVVICRNTMAKLFDFVTVNSKNFEIDVEIIGDKAIFIRKERKTTEIVDGFRGFGHTFPEEYTRWDSEVKGSSSHHRVAEYVFADLKYLLRFESDCYLAEKAVSVKEAPPARQGGKAGLVDTTALLSSSDTMSVGERRPTTSRGLVVRKGGREVDQVAAVEIKTRAAHKVLDMDSVLPRLWISQTPNLVAAYHRGGRFDDVQILDVRKDISRWEEQNSGNLRKLNTLVRRIIDTVQKTVAMKCRVRGSESGNLEIWELDISHKSALPDDLCLKLKEDKGLEDENEGWKQLGRGTPAKDRAEDYNDSGDDQDGDGRDDESDKDFTACSSEDCGHCGHCDY